MMSETNVTKAANAFFATTTHARKAILWDLLCEITGLGPVTATIMVREARYVPWAGSALRNPSKTTNVTFGLGPASRLRGFLHYSNREVSDNDLQKQAIHIAIAVCAQYQTYARSALEHVVHHHPDLPDTVYAYITEAHLAVAPAPAHVENMLCEGGKPVVGRTHGTFPPLLEYHVRRNRSELEKQKLLWVWTDGPLTPVRDEKGVCTSYVVWSRHPKNPKVD